jgi:hypothetical protein
MGDEPVSFAQAKLLKQHGFRWHTQRYYLPDGELRRGGGDHNRPARASPCGTVIWDSERYAAPPIRTAVVFYDTKMNPAYESIYLNEAVPVSTWRLDYLQERHGGEKVQQK